MSALYDRLGSDQSKARFIAQDQALMAEMLEIQAIFLNKMPASKSAHWFRGLK